MRFSRWFLPVALVTVVSAWLTLTRLHVSSDLSALFPDRGDAAALGRFVRAFGGGDLAVVLVRGANADDVEGAAHDLGETLRAAPSVTRVLDRAPLPRPPDPTLAWLYAGPAAREDLRRALTPEGMQQRLAGTRDLLLAPGSSDTETWLARDPLRLALVPWEKRAELAAGITSGSTGGGFVADEGRARLVILEPKGTAFDPAASKAFVEDVGAAIQKVRASRPGARMALTGGHAIAQATETMLIRDLALSGTLSLCLAAMMFVVTFRRARALVAVLPPLVLGTLWTTGLAALAPSGLSAIAIAFTAVVVGVGVDTGVHVYAALLEGRRQGLSPGEAATHARAKVWKPTILAALAAGIAFASLALSELTAMRQLGLLCGVGEVLTAVAIVLVTPAIGARLEKGEPPPLRLPSWVGLVEKATRTKRRAGIAALLAILPVLLLAMAGWPKTGGAIVAVRPHSLAPLVTQEEIYSLFGGRPGQWVVLSMDRDADRAAARADKVAEALEPLASDGTVDGFDALATYAPAPATQVARLAERDRLDLPARAPDLSAALTSAGFDANACEGGITAFLHPATDVHPLDLRPEGPIGWLVARHIAKDAQGTIAATYVRPRGDAAADARALEAIRAADPEAVITGYPYLETALKRALAHDLPRVGLVALVLVALALRAILGRMRDVFLALGAIVAEIAALALVMAVLHIRWHVYDALVVPVLIGVTIDESMFLLHAARERAAEPGDAIHHALATQGPLVASTALTTAAGFAALLVCHFDGLFDLGAVGALGVVLGLLAALVVVPAGLRLGGVSPGRS